MENYDWMDEAMVLAAQCWCDEETKSIEVDPILGEAIARRIALWMQTAAQNQRNADYYRGLLVECGKSIGEMAYTADDGTLCDDVLCAKIPELVDHLIRTAS